MRSLSTEVWGCAAAARERGPAVIRRRHGPADLIEAYLAIWLRGSVWGQSIVEQMGFEAAMDGAWAALNAGFIKLESDGDGFTGITPCNPPQPPTRQMARPRERARPDA